MSELMGNERLAARFDAASREHGFSAAGVGWESHDAQVLRFSVLAAAFLAEGSLLDVGCGQGHFIEFLRKTGRALDYEGIDLAEASLEIARARYPEARFRRADFLGLDLHDSHDFVVASGVLNLRIADDPREQQAHALAMIDSMYRAARKGIAFNMLSCLAPETLRLDESWAAYEPVRILEHCLGHSSYVEIKHTYLPHDFTVYLYRPPEFSAERQPRRTVLR